VHHPLGAAPGLASWRPNASATTTNFTLPFESAPFEAAGLKPYMSMIDGLNVVFATRDPNGNSGQNTHEGGMAVIMTGVPVLGKIGREDHAAGGASIDQLLLNNSPLLGGPTRSDATPFQSLQLAADVRSDRDEVAPRTLSYRPTLTNQSDISKARQPMAPDTQPLNVYGRSKAEGDRGVGIGTRRHIIVRTSWVYSHRRKNFVKTILQLAQTRDQLKVVADQHGCPTRASDIARACLDIAKHCVADGEGTPYGIYHYAGAGQTSWFEFATTIIDLAGKRLSRRPEILPIPTQDYPTPAIRPLDTRLDCGLVAKNFNIGLQPWQHALADTIDRLLTDEDFQ